jgi:predicted transcriptional regulator
MKDELVGHIASNNNKIKVLDILKSREGDLNLISKHSRIPEKVLSRIMNELVNDGVVDNRDGIYILTELGKEIINDVKGIR